MNKSEKLDELVTEVEELLARLPDSSDPEIAALRERVDNTILDTWTAVTRDRAEAAASAEDLIYSLNGYIHAHPWLMMAATAVLSISASFFVGRISRADSTRQP
ncbi:MAG TPA: hypothetical protein VGO37_20580 [Steroidobacteraceae bacterium]|jgi:ElaB/YqjD/DUF883 family membrane-anchored ribosome-binding protein|nr:hypothetical protein [Steroidobacteraceae bacterium]